MGWKNSCKAVIVQGHKPERGISGVSLVIKRVILLVIVPSERETGIRG